MKRIMPDKVHSAANCLRDIKNWIAVFKTEYDIPREAVRVLNKEIEEIADAMNGITCTLKGVDVKTVRPVANNIRDVKNWIAVFVDEYELPKETVKVLRNKLDQLAKAVAKIDCR